VQHAGAQAAGADITTIEGIAEADGTMHPMQAAFKECHGLQCGFCTPGMVMSAIDLCTHHPKPSDRDPRAARRQPVPLHRLPEHRQGREDGPARPWPRAPRSRPPSRPEGSSIMGASDFSNLPHIGEALRRKEDYRFLTGAGQYTDDITLANQSHAVFVRSPHAHAAIKSIDIAEALKMPGVVGMFSGKDIEGKMGGLPCGWLITSTDGTPMKEPPHPILAIKQGALRGRPRGHGGGRDGRAGQERGRGRGGRLRRAARAGERARRREGHGTTLHDEAPDNQCYKWALGDKAAVDAVFAKRRTSPSSTSSTTG
jgi:hypothetical protein